MNVDYAEQNFPEEARVGAAMVKAVGEGWETGWKWVEYDFGNNPPGLPPTPSISIDQDYKLTSEINNIDPVELGCDWLEVNVYKDNEIKYKTGMIHINPETKYTKFETMVEPGGIYKLRVRGVRGNNYGPWTEYTSNESTTPNPPSEITKIYTEQYMDGSQKKNRIYIEWPVIQQAKKYQIEYTTDPKLFDKSTGEVKSIETTEEQSNNVYVNDIEMGHKYYFRIRSINDKGSSKNWSIIKEVTIGSKPGVPTIWSDRNSYVLGKEIKLYWKHNPSDNSLETQAKISFRIRKKDTPMPIEKNVIIRNTRNPETDNGIGTYTISNTIAEWNILKGGDKVSWEVQTMGIGRRLQ